MTAQMMKHAADSDRVRANTWPEVNHRLDREAEQRVRQWARHGAGALADRIGELEREWDFERVLEAEAASMGLVGLALALAAGPRYLTLPGVIAGMVLLHATHGWYPLLPLFRRMGVRTRNEIDRELYAIKALRGDFAPVAETEGDGERRAAAAWRAVCE